MRSGYAHAVVWVAWQRLPGRWRPPACRAAESRCACRGARPHRRSWKGGLWRERATSFARDHYDYRVTPWQGFTSTPSWRIPHLGGSGDDGEAARADRVDPDVVGAELACQHTSSCREGPLSRRRTVEPACWTGSRSCATQAMNMSSDGQSRPQSRSRSGADLFSRRTGGGFERAPFVAGRRGPAYKPGVMTAFDVAAARERSLLAAELQDAWPVLSPEERLEGLRLLTYGDAEDFLLGLPARDQSELILATGPGERRSWMRLLPPDDAADVIQEAPEEEREALLSLLDEPTRKEVAALLAYAEDDAGGLMNPRYARAASRDERRRGDHLPAPSGPGASRDDLLRLRARCRAAPARRGLVPRAVLRAHPTRRCATSCTPTSSRLPRRWTRKPSAGCSPSTTSWPFRWSTPSGA